MRLSEWVGRRDDGQGLNVTVVRAEDRADQDRWPDKARVLRLVDLWTTVNGSWDNVGQKWALPQWARDEYLKPMGHPRYINAGGADHHLLASRQGPAGELLPGAGIIFGSDGLANLNSPALWNQQTCGPDGWWNMEMFASSCYYPDQGQQGPWCWFPFGYSDIVVGGGMPYRNHVSFFAVWREVAVGWGGGEEGSEPGIPVDLAPLLARLDRLATAVEHVDSTLREVNRLPQR